MENKLNIGNPEYILWEFEQIRVAIFGGLKIEGLDRMKVTLKIEWKELVVRHNLDLYNEAAVDRLIKRCAERFSLGSSYLAGIITSLTNTLEEYRLEELKKGLKKNPDHP